MIRLSICIATFNRGAVIGRTLASIVDQIVDGVEVVVLDGASPDDTETTVRAVSERCPAVRYIRAATNSGVDADFDLAVQYAHGAYCWLFSDDDLLAPGAVATVLAELSSSRPDLLVVDAEIRDANLDKRFETGRLKFADRRVYGPCDGDAFMRNAGNAMSFIGGSIFRRSVWLARERTPYYGSLFIHVGVAFQQPALARCVVMPRNLVQIRIGNANWTARSFEIWMFLWPRLIWNMPGYSEAARRAVTASEPYRQIGRLLIFRARGCYGSEEYDRFLRGRSLGMRRPLAWLVARAPGRLVHLTTVLLLGLFGYGRGSMMYEINHNSRFANPVSNALARCFGLRRTAA